jgi:hypothetical protein
MLQVEAVEARRLPSSATPVLTSHTLDTVVASVEQVVARLVRTHDAARAANRLTSLAASIPFGRRQLAPAWVSALVVYNPAVPGSGRPMVRLLLADLKQDLAFGIASGELRVTGKDAAILTRAGLGAPLVSLDSVRVANNTSLTLGVTVTLNNTGRSIPMTISSSAVALFDFGTATGNFMAISVRNANGTSPPPFSTGLNKPFMGYNGALFTVSVFGGFFSVSG